jgi:hypothetical protein
VPHDVTEESEDGECEGEISITVADAELIEELKKVKIVMQVNKHVGKVLSWFIGEGAARTSSTLTSLLEMAWPRSKSGSGESSWWERDVCISARRHVVRGP